MILYVPAILSIVVGCALFFHSMGRLRPVAVTAVVILTYFYVVVAAFYHELMFEDNEKKEEGAATDQEKGGKKDTCLIALDDINEEHRALANGKLVLDTAVSENDDTFSELATRPKLLSTNPFKDDVDGMEGGAAAADAPDDRDADVTARTLLPQPDEIIQVEKKRQDESCSWFDSPFRQQSKSKSIDLTPATKMSLLAPPDNDKDGANVSDSTSRLNPDDTAAGVSFSRPSASRSLSHSGLLLGNIDSNFTPFKSGRKCQGEEGGEGDSSPPKMKVFLPKSPEEGESSEEEEDSSDEDGQARRPLKPTPEA